MTCHNRETHEFQNPNDALDDAMSRVVSPDIPYMKQNALAVMERQYPNMDEALRRAGSQGLLRSQLARLLRGEPRRRRPIGG
ncbi:MAG: hypothetical protein R2854_04940 [Caldilineaceae bacterium]